MSDPNKDLFDLCQLNQMAEREEVMPRVEIDAGTHKKAIQVATKLTMGRILRHPAAIDEGGVERKKKFQAECQEITSRGRNDTT